MEYTENVSVNADVFYNNLRVCVQVFLAIVHWCYANKESPHSRNLLTVTGMHFITPRNLGPTVCRP